jgi:hypothetical protein
MIPNIFVENGLWKVVLKEALYKTKPISTARTLRAALPRGGMWGERPRSPGIAALRSQ